jgi:hypothetical protein
MELHLFKLVIEISHFNKDLHRDCSIQVLQPGALWKRLGYRRSQLPWSNSRQNRWCNVPHRSSIKPTIRPKEHRHTIS